MAKLPSVDCGCNKTGKFVPPVDPDPTSPTADQKYVVQHSTTAVTVRRASDNSIRFQQTGIQNSFAFGFGPRSDYLLYAPKTSDGTITATVHNLETKAQVFFQ